MPYIKAETRQKFVKLLKIISITRDNDGHLPVGELNYLITKLLVKSNPNSYKDFNDLVGVLECVKLEFYRRAIAAYEDEKIKENGDVY